jgi:hypothetical protein
MSAGTYYGTFGKTEGRTADPSTPLRSGRDDKVELGVYQYVFLLGCLNPSLGFSCDALLSTLSSRPERSGVEGSAVRPSVFPYAP